MATMATVVVSKESTWLEDVKGQILDRLDVDDFASVERLASLALKVQGVIANGHQKDGKQSFRCPHCMSSFKNNSALREHIKFKHGGEKPVKCDVCKKTFNTRHALAVHLRTDNGRHPEGH